MRLIDTWQTCDLPYEQTALAIDDGNIVAHFGDRTILMAEYSDIEIAKKVMTKMRIAYQGLLHDAIAVTTGHHSEYFRFPTEEYL